MRAMIFAAGRGARMRPLTDATPKPLLPVFGKPLLQWHLEKLAAAKIVDVVINVSYLAQQIMDYVGDGSQFGVRAQFSVEPIALEAGGGLATAAPLLGNGAIVVISSDVYSDLDYALFRTYGATLASDRAHWWFAPQHANAPGREFSLRNGRVFPPGDDAQTLANVGLVHSSLIADWPRGKAFKLLPHYQAWVGNGWVTGSHIEGRWENVTDPLDLERLRA
jgi:MurNAc alpha-1-phosphate uridylyltransferase